MLLGSVGLAAMALIFLHLIIWQVRAVSWLPNYVGTCLAVGALGGISVGFFITGSVHLIFSGIALICIGIPSFLFMNKYPRKRRKEWWVE